ncbi:hypothetical protein Micbo1qcDRAFT_5243 [Microdochium bolleyi]|uniref:Uncharacterized protein n=1 Tax=Microdochium bolleyi TaxID=196109 RepID=A0A136JIW8_9PEZI|nr:hypothetical protein Micbo1qcDRAFT_5243 [Microdochium bolleyi]
MCHLDSRARRSTRCTPRRLLPCNYCEDRPARLGFLARNMPRCHQRLRSKDADCINQILPAPESDDTGSGRSWPRIMRLNGARRFQAGWTFPSGIILPFDSQGAGRLACGGTTHARRDGHDSSGPSNYYSLTT